MLPRRLMPLAIAIAAIGMATLGGLNRAEAAVEVVVEDGVAADTLVFYSSDSTSLNTGTFTIGPYSAQIQTVLTNYPGAEPDSQISTTINIKMVTSSTAGKPLTSTITVVKGVAAANALPNSGTGVLVTGAVAAAVLASPKIAWALPISGNGINNVLAGVSSTTNKTTGTAVTTTFYDSPPDLTPGPGTAAISTAPLAFSGAPDAKSASTTGSDAPFTLSQRVTATGLPTTSTLVNINASSDVTPQQPVNIAPEPSSMALAGLGSLGLIGYGLRRRKALGA